MLIGRFDCPAQSEHLPDRETRVAITRLHGTLRQQISNVFEEVERTALTPHAQRVVSPARTSRGPSEGVVPFTKSNVASQSQAMSTHQQTGVDAPPKRYAFCSPSLTTAYPAFARTSGIDRTRSRSIALIFSGTSFHGRRYALRFGSDGVGFPGLNPAA